MFKTLNIHVKLSNGERINSSGRVAAIDNTCNMVKCLKGIEMGLKQGLQGKASKCLVCNEL